MPTDRNGHQLKRGDRVTLTCEVTEVRHGDDGQNVQVQVTQPEGVLEFLPTLYLNGRLAEKKANEADALLAEFRKILAEYKDALAGIGVVDDGK